MPIMAGILGALLVNSITVEGLGAVANVSSWWLVIVVGWSAAGVLSASAGTDRPALGCRVPAPTPPSEQPALSPGRVNGLLSGIVAGVQRTKPSRRLGKIPQKRYPHAR